MALVHLDETAQALNICEVVPPNAIENAPLLTLACVILQCRLNMSEPCLLNIETTAARIDAAPEDIVEMLADTARLMHEEARYAEAERLLLTTETLQPSNLWHQVRLGEALAAQKRYPEALERYRRVLAAVPDSPYTATQLDLVYEVLDDPEACFQEWKTLSLMHPESHMIQEHLQTAETKLYEENQKTH